MAWMIMHKCHNADPEPRPYGLVRRNDEHGDPVTLAVCSKDDNGCGEQLVFKGHDVFEEAHTAVEVQGSHMPPGFVVAHAVPD